ncbi:hypothetical protein N0V93_000279 [Gnomoniopsis smithogilvyi]|uniref:Heterokaryon incompatibility domain-containing protein n=1 Tax=Gnomoniopsis smithogilvyi TaxID=1191159 RepID=A0A9W9D030_9PEZI|nr:hypothetical protein N0V93_000279 [Gnomoniopsis smithogilvyi]
MRLINSRTLELESFGPQEIPNYAILSHRWCHSEASYTHWRSRLTRLRKANKPGFAKILATCKQARRDGLSYVWVDTVCIDRTSSAELSEAINSMFAWYERAAICYAYLADVPSASTGNVDMLEIIATSTWFTRGWTLQELIAPSHVVFYSDSWTNLGTKKALASFLSRITGIEQLCISKEKELRRCSIAQRMSWAANRSTTRPEDMAYCLLGIFGINLPLIYGEGHRAFIRLQEEIIRTSDDHSILAFNTILSRNSLLADHPSLFRDMKSLQPSMSSRITPPFSMTNAGLSIRTPLIQTLSPYWVLAVLNCIEVQAQKGMHKSQICLPLFGKDGVYMRARTPVCLIRQNLSEMQIPGIQSEIEDLTTSEETKFLISHFTRVYPAFGYQLDLALNGFDEEPMGISGFMLTFPRGMGNFKLARAYPQEALQRNTSFFVPSAASSGQPFAHGLLVFEDHSTPGGPPVRIAVYLAHNLLDTGAQDWGGQWMCVLTERNLDDNDDGGNLYDLCCSSWQFEKDPEDWAHYDHLGDFIVAARTKFALQQPMRHVIMVELIFDARTLMRERDLDIGSVILGLV